MGISIYSAESFKPKYVEFVYSLRNPINNEIFYVGKTQNLKERWKAHIQEAKKDKNCSDKCALIREILKEGKLPIIREIDRTYVRTEIDKYLASYKEIKWILFYLEIGWKLTNVSCINNDLSQTDYIRYKEKKRTITYSHYHYGQDQKGNEVYDLKRIKADGYAPPEEIITPYDWGKYNPYKNWRFIKKNGLSEDQYEGEHYTFLDYQYDDERINEY